jgi:hypothetical protein
VRDYKSASTVTVSQTTNLVNQMVTVSWTGFTPSSQPQYDNSVTDYPVMVAQCKGWHPTDPSQCYDATNGGTPASFGSYGPGNTAYGTTNSHGDGQTDILLFTSVQNQFLKCDKTHPCSLVIVPSQGGDSIDYASPHCGNHGADNQETDLGQYAFLPIQASPYSPSGLCSWRQRIVIPLSFAATPSGCPLRTADFSAAGSPMLANAMQQWQSGICFGSNPIEIQYNSELNESEARNNFLDGLTDIGFTTEPATGTGKYPYTYAPVAVSAASLVYWVDNSLTGQPFSGIKISARLLTKLLTTSYAFTNEGCPSTGSGSFGCDGAVDRNPENLYADPEFRALNKSTTWKDAAQPSGYEVPSVVSGNSDITLVTTSWLAADKTATDFLAGQYDPWGMHVNTYYLGQKFPTDGFLPMDPYFPLSSQYAPVYPMSEIALDQSLNQQPGTQDTRDPTTGNYDALPPQVPGNRDLWALDDQPDAARFLFPVAALENAAGRFVEPTDASMAAAVRDMTVNQDKITRSMNFAKKDPAAYPLTMVIYAMVPTGGISAAKAAKIAEFLDFAANAGQQRGNAPGELAPGYLPLPAALRQQTLTAASEVLNQTGNPKPKPKIKPSAVASATPAPTSAAPTPSHTASSVVLSFSQPYATGMSWMVLALLIAGALLMVAGPAALVYGSPGARAAIGNGGRRLRQVAGRARNWPGRLRLRMERAD